VSEKAAKPPKKKKPIYKRKWPWLILAGVAAFVGLVGPWPTYSTHYDDTDYAKATFARIGTLPLEASRGEAMAGMAVADITPPVGEPMAGFSARDPMESEAILDRVYVKALSLSNSHRTVTIVGGDILLVSPALREEVLRRVGLSRQDVYFTASHTHSGPGGYQPGWVWEAVLGSYDEKILSRLADAMADVITRSRTDMTPARVGVGLVVRTRFLARNRLDSTPAHQTLAMLVVRRADGPGFLGTMVCFPAHPLCLGKENRSISGDYPGVVQRSVEQPTRAPCLFAVGATGSMVPASDLPRGQERMNEYGTCVAALARGVCGEPPLDDFRAVLDSKKDMRALGLAGRLPDREPGVIARAQFPDPERKLALAAGVLEVDLPPQQYRISEHLRLSPVAASWLHDRKSYIHVLRINDAVLLGMPADYSGELAAELEEYAEGSGLFPLVTSFNGDYVGYLLPRRRYGTPHFETRDENLFGPWCGEYFNEISRRVVARLAAAARTEEAKQQELPEADSP